MRGRAVWEGSMAAMGSSEQGNPSRVAGPQAENHSHSHALAASSYIVYSSQESSYLGDLIANELGVPRGKIARSSFKGGEKVKSPFPEFNSFCRTWEQPPDAAHRVVVPSGAVSARAQGARVLFSAGAFGFKG